ncbi:MAG: hypothetical protein KGM44_07545 [bacterium]|nr:hypothetical protein [bacterium]
MANHDPLEKALGEILKGIPPLPHTPAGSKPERLPKPPKRRKGEPDAAMEPEAWDRYRTCERKKAYPNETAARMDALRQRRRLFVYRCRFCEQYHLTSQGGES